MEVVRAEVHAMTASFRYPMFVVSYQPTYSIPPISTILGMLSAAKGEKVDPDGIRIGYNFTSGGKGVDLEKIHILGDEKKTKPVSYQGSNVVKREFLYDCNLTLYIDDPGFLDYLKKPQYNLLLGRQSDLAFVRKIDEISISESKDVNLNNTIVPFPSGVSGQIVSLPVDFTDSSNRKPKNVKNFCIIETSQQIEKAYYDSEKEQGVYMHELLS